MGFWPFSMIWAAIDEPWRYIYDLLAGVFQRISDSVYKAAGCDNDFNKKKQEEIEFPGID
jgi:hypothetical protein